MNKRQVYLILPNLRRVSMKIYFFILITAILNKRPSERAMKKLTVRDVEKDPLTRSYRGQQLRR